MDRRCERPRLRWPSTRRCGSARLRMYQAKLDACGVTLRVPNRCPPIEALAADAG
jgi:hypothetical protein